MNNYFKLTTREQPPRIKTFFFDDEDKHSISAAWARVLSFRIEYSKSGVDHFTSVYDKIERYSGPWDSLQEL